MHHICRFCGSGLFVIGFIAGAGGSEPVFIYICPECDGPCAEDRANR